MNLKIRISSLNELDPKLDHLSDTLQHKIRYPEETYEQFPVTDMIDFY